MKRLMMFACLLAATATAWGADYLLPETIRLTPDGQKAHDGPHVVIARVGPLGRAEEATQAAFLGFGSERLEVALDELVPMWG